MPRAHSDRVIKITEDITDEVGQSIVEDLLRYQGDSDKPVQLLISSDGGLLYPAFRVCDLIKNVLTVPVDAVAFGVCNSAASLILIHCRKRIATPNTRFLIHSVEYEGVNTSFTKNVQRDTNRLLREGSSLKKQMVRMYMHQLGLTKQEALLLIKRGDNRYDNSLNAKQALRLRIITGITPGKAGVF